MAEFSITIPDEQVSLIGEAFADTYATSLGATPPSDPMMFARDQVILFITNVVRGYLTTKAIREAQAAIPDGPFGIS